MLALTLGPMWAFVLDEIKHERTLTVQAARNNAMNLATAFEAHVLSTIRLMDIVLLDMREDVLEHTNFGRHVDEELKAYGGFIAQLAVIDRDGRLVFSNLGPSESTWTLAIASTFACIATTRGRVGCSSASRC